MNELPPIAELVPHGPPMILLDELLEWSPGRARCGVRLGPNSSFMEDGRVRAVVAIEYMAQAVAACAGMDARAQGRPHGAGFLLGTRDLELSVSHLSAGDFLEIEVEYLSGDERLVSYCCRARKGLETVAAAVLNFYLQDQERLKATP